MHIQLELESKLHQFFVYLWNDWNNLCQKVGTYVYDVSNIIRWNSNMPVEWYGCMCGSNGSTLHFCYMMWYDITIYYLFFY